MSGRSWCPALAGLGAAICLASLHAQTPQDTPPPFRANTEAVYVIATVMQKDGTLVTDLTQDDFEVKDNGEARPIAVFRNDPVPFAAAIMLDISGSMIENLDLMRSGMEEFVRYFQPGDRATVGTFAGLPLVAPYFTSHPPTLSNWVSASMGGMGSPCFAPSGRSAWIKLMYPHAGTAVWDGLLCGLNTIYHDSETPRRVVVIVTDAMDNVSDNRPSDVERLADDLGAMIYGIGIRGSEGLDDPILRELAQHTGGGYYTLTGGTDLPKTFERIAEELRHQYVFGFTPASGGDKKRKLEVTTKRPGLIVHARRMQVEISPVSGAGGIPMIPADPPPPAPAPESAKTDAPANIGRTDLQSARGPLPYVLDRFEAGEWGVSSAIDPPRLMSIVTDGLKRDAPGWIAERGSNDVVRRRLAVATYALTLLDSMTAPSLWQDQQPAANLLEATCALLRQGAPTPAERLWFVASFGLMERSSPPAVMLKHVAHAEERFPAEARWALIRAVGAERQAPVTFLANGTPLLASGAAQVFEAHKRASAVPAIHAESETRWGFYVMLAGRLDEAMTHFQSAGEPDDLVVRYWLHLFKGEAFERAQRVTEAVAEYRRAAETVPLAQAAGLSLASALVTTQRTSEAAALTLQLLNSGSVEDPWLYFGMPDARFWTPILSDLRQAIVR